MIYLRAYESSDYCSVCHKLRYIKLLMTEEEIKNMCKCKNKDISTHGKNKRIFKKEITWVSV